MVEEAITGTPPLPTSIGRYEINGELGRGGMATVFRAVDPRFEREVALKILPQAMLHDTEFRARFEREAKVVAGLEHSAIVPVYDFGEDKGQPFLVMRLMRGGSLTDRIMEGPLSLEETARIYRRLGGGLTYAHTHGIIHRDLKPANILFDRTNDPYIADFGIAKLTESGTLTGSHIIGTPAYMSPEQARGEPHIDGRSDVYALGAILFEMLTGKQPYEAETPMGLAMRHITDPVPTIRMVKPDLPEGCEVLISKAMAKFPEDRFDTAEDLAAALTDVAEGKVLHIEAPPKTKTGVRLAQGAVPAVPAVPAVAAPPIPADDDPGTIAMNNPRSAATVLGRLGEPISDTNWHKTQPLAGLLGPNWDLQKQFQVFAKEAFCKDTWKYAWKTFWADHRTLIGWVILALGIRAGVQALGIGTGALLWPWFVLMPAILAIGAAFAIRKEKTNWLVIPGMTILAVGLILQFNAVTNYWAVWAYAGVTVLLCGPGMGLVLYGYLGDKLKSLRVGRWLNTIGFLIAVALGVFLELVVRFTGNPIRGLISLAVGLFFAVLWNRVMARLTRDWQPLAEPLAA